MKLTSVDSLCEKPPKTIPNYGDNSTHLHPYLVSGIVYSCSFYNGKITVALDDVV